MLKIRIFTILLFLFVFGCKKQGAQVVEIKNTETDIASEVFVEDPGNTTTLTRYAGMDDVFSPDGKILRVYNNEVKETQWGPIYSPVIYLYDGENRILSKYNTFELVSEDFWPGNIRINYNNKRNSFDMIFGLDAYGNYGTGYIDLNNNRYFRELLSLPNDKQNDQEFQQQGIPYDYIDGSNFNQ
jgi:hypothetical protein